MDANSWIQIQAVCFQRLCSNHYTIPPLLDFFLRHKCLLHSFCSHLLTFHSAPVTGIHCWWAQAIWKPISSRFCPWGPHGAVGRGRWVTTCQLGTLNVFFCYGTGTCIVCNPQNSPGLDISVLTVFYFLMGVHYNAEVLCQERGLSPADLWVPLTCHL